MGVNDGVRPLCFGGVEFIWVICRGGRPDRPCVGYSSDTGERGVRPYENEKCVCLSGVHRTPLHIINALSGDRVSPLRVRTQPSITNGI